MADNLLAKQLLSRDSLFNSPHENSISRNISFRASLEPLRDFKLELTATQVYATREEYYYKYLSSEGDVVGPLSYTMAGNYTTTLVSLGTAFRNADDLFQQFLDARSIIAERLADLNPDPYNAQQVLDTMNGQYFPAGYSANQQTVLLAAFLSTYLGKNPSRQSFSPFRSIPIPNWSINYTGLNKVQALKKWFTNIAISHRYSSTYTIGSFYTDPSLSNMDGYTYGSETLTNSTGDYIPPVSMEGVQISEQLNPLLRLSLSMVNSFTFNISVQKSRTLLLSFSNNQLTETTRSGLTIGTGYRIKDVAFTVQFAGKNHDLKSDIVLAVNITRNSNRTTIRKINLAQSQVSAGSEVWMIDVSAEYALSTHLSVRAFFQTNINNPYILNTYPNSTSKGGIMLRASF